MNATHAIGWCACALMLMTFWCETAWCLRSFAIAANLAFIAYGWAAELPPVLALHLVLLPINLLRWFRSIRQRRGVGHGFSDRPLVLDRLDRARPWTRPIADPPIPGAPMNSPNRRLNRPEFAWPGTEARLTLGFVAFLISSALVGGLLGLFEMRSNNAATARAVAQNRKASGVLAEREQRPPADATNARRRPSLPPA